MNNKMQLEEGGYFTISRCETCGESLGAFLSEKRVCEACTKEKVEPIINDLLDVKQSQDYQPYYFG